MDIPNLSPTEIWTRVFSQVQQTVGNPMLWLSMQAAQPITVDGNYFVVGLSAEKQYMATNLKTFSNVSAIEEALRQVSGHILAFRLIEGETLADWQAAREKERTVSAEPSSDPAAPQPTAAPSVGAQATLPPEPPREVMPTWEKLNERLTPMYKAAPAVRYPHGQARFVLEAVKYVSDTMDVLMPGGQPTDEAQEKALAKALERLSTTVNLDAMFLALELYRYRASRGK